MTFILIHWDNDGRHETCTSDAAHALDFERCCRNAGLRFQVISYEH